MDRHCNIGNQPYTYKGCCRPAKELGDVPLVVANDGDVTALAGAMSLNDNNVLVFSYYIYENERNHSKFYYLEHVGRGHVFLTQQPTFLRKVPFPLRGATQKSKKM